MQYYLDCIDKKLYIAWYTELEGEPNVYLTSSSDSGYSFAKPKSANDGLTIGRVDIEALNNGTTEISYMESDGNEDGSIIIRTVNADGSLTPPNIYGKTSNSRASDFYENQKRAR